LGELCKQRSVTFRYIAGKENPADYISRPISYNKLIKTNYYTGPEFLQNIKVENQPDIEVTVPNPLIGKAGTGFDNEQGDFGGRPLLTTVSVSAAKLLHEDCTVKFNPCEPLVKYSDYSSYNKLVRVHTLVFKFIYNLKAKIGKLNDVNKANIRIQASNFITRAEQHSCFPDIFEFFHSKRLVKNKIPALVLQMNLYLDDNGLIRIKSKFEESNSHPLLLPSDSVLAALIVWEVHRTFCHAGIYTVLRKVRKEFWITRGFSVVRKVLKSCITCKRLNARPVKLNQSNYRSFRHDPPKIPFRSVFLDYIGPVVIKLNNENKKIWLLIITCLYSRAVSLQICMNADTVEFLRNLQIHVYQFGLFTSCLSDLGSQIKSGLNVVHDFLDDIECHNYFQKNGISKLTFEQYAKGNSSLGSLVESLVKQTKHLMTKSIGRNILQFTDFQLLVSKTVSVINKRTVAFQSGLRDHSGDVEIPEAITPEMLVYGRELVTMNIIPDLHPDSIDDRSYNPVDDIRLNYAKLKKVNDRLVKLYNEEFLVQLISNAIDHKDRYKPVNHVKLGIGDIVLLVEPLTKQCNYPLGIVRKIEENSLGEVTSAIVFKGGTREEVYRHSSSLILLLHSRDEYKPDDVESDDTDDEEEVTSPVHSRPQRRAAIVARSKFASSD